MKNVSKAEQKVPTLSRGALARILQQAGLRPLSAYRAREILAILLAVGPPVVIACLAGNPNRWELFERSGSATSAIGLLLASRSYVKHSAFELARLHADPEREVNMALLMEDIFSAKLGLALSALGTIIWGWGSYLCWWSFGFLIVWALIVGRDIYRDLVRPGVTSLPILNHGLDGQV